VENFTAKDISAIIDSCKGSGIRTLEYEGLKLTFESEPETVPYREPAFVDLPQQGNEKELLEERQVEDDEELRDLELQNLMMSDPIGYEKHMRYEDETS